MKVGGLYNMNMNMTVVGQGEPPYNGQWIVKMNKERSYEHEWLITWPFSETATDAMNININIIYENIECRYTLYTMLLI